MKTLPLAEQLVALDETTEAILRNGLNSVYAAKTVAARHGLHTSSIYLLAREHGHPLAAFDHRPSSFSAPADPTRAEAALRWELETMEAAKAAACMRQYLREAAANGDAQMVRACAGAYRILIDHAPAMDDVPRPKVRTREELVAEAIRARDELRARRARHEAHEPQSPGTPSPSDGTSP